MELWRVEDPKRPEVLNTRTLSIALALHVLIFLFFAILAVVNFHKPEEVIPIDLTVIVNENLDGEEDKPPPLKNPTEPEPPPPPEPPKPDPPKKVEPPKALEQIITNIVEKKEAPEKKPEPPKVEPPKKPEPPKKTKEELMKERMAKMRKSAVVNNKRVTIEVPNAAASANGRTARQTMSPDQIRALLNQGYRPGTQNQLATSERQRCISLIQRALNEKWDQVAPKIGREGTVLLSARFNSSGGLVGVHISRSCGDKVSDAAALSVARQVTHIPGLSPAFIAEFQKEALTIQYDVRGR